jgi:hypothetical protein
LTEAIVPVRHAGVPTALTRTRNPTAARNESTPFVAAPLSCALIAFVRIHTAATTAPIHTRFNNTRDTLLMGLEEFAIRELIAD